MIIHLHSNSIILIVSMHRIELFVNYKKGRLMGNKCAAIHNKDRKDVSNTFPTVVVYLLLVIVMNDNSYNSNVISL